MAYRKNGFKAPDRVIFIGCTRDPHKANKKDLWDFFDKHLHLPFPDYATRKLLWSTFVAKLLKESDVKDVPAGLEASFGTLARITDGFSAGSIGKVVKKTLTPKRVTCIRSRPVDGGEFLNSLALEAAANQATFAEQSVVYADFTETITRLADHKARSHE